MSEHLIHTLNIRKQTARLTLHQLFVGLLRRRFLLPGDINLPSVRLTTPHFQTRAAQVAAGTYAIYTP